MSEIILICAGIVVLLLLVMHLRAMREHCRFAADATRRQAQLYRNLAEAEAELAQYTFAADDERRARLRLELVDLHTEGAAEHERFAAEYDRLAAWPLHRLRRRKS